MTQTFHKDPTGRNVIDKDPGATLDYSFDWTPWLDLYEDTIDQQTVTVDEASGVTLDSTDVIDSKIVTAWITGGTVGKTARVTCSIVTTGGRIDDRTIYLNIISK